MRTRTPLFAALALGLFGGVAWLGVGQFIQQRGLNTLVHTLREQMVFVEGGHFQMGNYMFAYRQPDGRVEQIWAASSEPSEQRHVTLNSFYLSAYEASYADFNIYLRAQGLPVLQEDVSAGIYLSDRGAQVSFDEAQRYCAWAGEITGLPMRLPSEAEWEYAARSRGQVVPWATDDGNFRPGQNVVPTGTRDTPWELTRPPIGTFPPNPLGFYNMQDGVYEWVTGDPETDPEGAGIFKGGSDFSSRFYETIPHRGLRLRLSDADVTRLTAIIDGAALERFLQSDDRHSPFALHTGVRCAADVSGEAEAAGSDKQAPRDLYLSPPFWGHEG